MNHVTTNKPSLPHNIQMEQAILAALMTVVGSYESVSEIITEEDFYAQRHKLIFRAVVNLVTSDQPHDTIMVHDWLVLHNLSEASGGEEYLIQLMAESPSNFYNLVNYAQKIKEFSTLRNLIETGHKIALNASNPDGKSVDEILETSESAMFSLAEQHHNKTKKSGPQNASTFMTKVFDKLNEISTSGTGLTGYTTGFVELDNKLNGMQKSDLIIVAARPSMGKTTFAMNLVESVLYNCNLPALVFSMEMPSESIGMRMLSSFGKVNQTKLRSGQLNADDWTKITSSVVFIQDKPIFVDDSSALPPNELRSRARKVAKECGGQLGCIMVDYLQLMKVPGMGDNRVGEISEISRSLKALAKEMNCPVIALSQLNRSLENRPNKRPIMSDLRESGAIEQDADVIMFIYRDEVYNKDSKEAGIAEIIIGKQRNGPIGTVRLAFEGPYCRFANLSPEYYENHQGDE